MLYETEEQQAEALQKFWKENGKTILCGVLIGIAGIFGWQYYKQYQLQQMEKSTEQYIQTFKRISTNYNDATVTAVSDFISQHKSDTYGEIAALNLASQLVDFGGDFEKAERYLKIAEGSGDSAVSSIAKIRLARVQTQLAKYDEAEKTVRSVKAKMYQATVNEILGDIAFAKGDQNAARKAYQAAYDLVKGTNEEKMNVMLKIKLDDLSVASGSASSAVKVEEKKEAAAPAVKAEEKKEPAQSEEKNQ
ncbi:MAG: tetratricopeptide repeat protein [Succinivibrionaceae bacterium]|nr:tetratricopeptide repeat protein [Succinivibrionaceae bacterium]